jgi:C4-dicarboxylate-specific signal transduction histidine kinase
MSGARPICPANTPRIAPHAADVPAPLTAEELRLRIAASEVDLLIEGVLLARPGLVVLIDGNATVLKCKGNRREADALPGFDAPGAVSQRYDALLDEATDQDPAERAAVLEALDAVLRGDPGITRHCWVHGPADTWLDILMHRLPGEPRLALISHIDATQRRREDLQAARIRAQVMHWDRVMTVGELSASLTHELAQPLTAVLGNAQAALNFLARGEVAEVHDALTDIVGNGERAGRILHGMRSLLKHGHRRDEPVHLDTAIQDAVRMVGPEARRSRIALSLQLAHTSGTIRGDAVQIQQLLINLLTNAFHALARTNSHPRWVNVATGSGADGKIELTVEDSGPGIDPCMRDAVFEPFFSTRSDGLGMGLHIAKTIVQAHGGRIAVEAGSAGGALFRCDFPAAAEQGPP